MNLAAYYPLYTEQNATYNQQFQFRETDTPDGCGPESGVPVDIRGWTAKMQIRETTSLNVVHELTHADGIEIENSDQGYFVISLPHTKTEVLTQKNYQYDLFLIDPEGVVFRLLYGPILNNTAITNPV